MAERKLDLHCVSHRHPLTSWITATYLPPVRPAESSWTYCNGGGTIPQCCILSVQYRNLQENCKVSGEKKCWKHVTCFIDSLGNMRDYCHQFSHFSLAMFSLPGSELLNVEQLGDQEWKKKILSPIGTWSNQFSPQLMASICCQGNQLSPDRYGTFKNNPALFFQTGKLKVSLVAYILQYNETVVHTLPTGRIQFIPPR